MKVLNNHKGQGLIEAMIAVAVIVTGIVGSISLISYSLRSSAFTMNRLIALNLSWEGIEVVQYLRDSNFLAGRDFNYLLDGGTDDTAVLFFDELDHDWSVDFSVNDFSDQRTYFWLNNDRIYQQGLIKPLPIEISSDESGGMDFFSTQTVFAKDEFEEEVPISIGTRSVFQRLLSIDNSIAGQMSVRSEVRWQERGDTRSIVSERVFYDWRSSL